MGAGAGCRGSTAHVLLARRAAAAGPRRAAACCLSRAWHAQRSNRALCKHVQIATKEAVCVACDMHTSASTTDKCINKYQQCVSIELQPLVSHSLARLATYSLSLPRSTALLPIHTALSLSLSVIYQAVGHLFCVAQSIVPSPLAESKLTFVPSLNLRRHTCSE